MRPSVGLPKPGCRVSLFIDPDPRAIDRARELGVPAVELHTGRYAHAWQDDDRAREELAARRSPRRRSLGLAVHAGHGLTYANVQPVARIPEIEELNIGHSMVSRAVFVGLREAVLEMGRMVRSGPSGQNGQ